MINYDSRTSADCDFGVRETAKETMTNEELEKLVLFLEERISTLEDEVSRLKFPLK